MKFDKQALQRDLKRKVAELDMLDDQLMAMDTVIPEGDTTPEFDLLLKSATSWNRTSARCGNVSSF
jgi:hypothetical protein